LAQRHTGSVLPDNCLALPNGRYISWSHGLQLWSYYGQEIGEPAERGTDGAILIGPDRLLTWNVLGVFRVRDLDLKPIGNEVRAHSRPTRVIRLGTDRLLSMSRDTTMRLWTSDGDLASAPMCGHQAEVTGAAELDDKRILSWSADRTLRLWSKEGKPLRRHLFWYGVPVEAPPDNLMFRTEDFRHVRCLVD
jgi:WD40 repeat protein